MLTAGNLAPDFSLTDQHGKNVRLTDFRGRQSVVLYFYPKDDTPLCTREACAFRDAYQDFADAGAAVIGVSRDTQARHGAFAAKHRLNFTLLTDADGALRQAYGVPKALGLLDGRVTFVIGRDGVICHAFKGHFTAQQHINQALRTVRTLAAAA